jgi:hypothetical protein
MGEAFPKSGESVARSWSVPVPAEAAAWRRSGVSIAVRSLALAPVEVSVAARKDDLVGGLVVVEEPSDFLPPWPSVGRVPWPWAGAAPGAAGCMGRPSVLDWLLDMLAILLGSVAIFFFFFFFLLF